jgi:nickel/cobalt transporter (NiCoT) family protein
MHPAVRGWVGRLFDDEQENARSKVTAICLLPLAANASAWTWALVAFREDPVLLGTALLAYTFGLRHAVDPDHIAAIDNVARKLMHMQKRPLSVGLFFALGHSTVVVTVSVFVALAMGAIKPGLENFREIAGLVGTVISVLFLLSVAGANIIVLFSVIRIFGGVRRGEHFLEKDFNILLSQRGFLGRRLRTLFAIISRSWHMYPLGVLFGLGFDTASEIGLLGISAAQGTQGLSTWSILIFPALFTAGMSLIDTIDGALMVGIYGWTFVKPIRKLYYNITITSVSVIVALVIGGVEALGLLDDKLGVDCGKCKFIQALNQSFGALGYVIIGIFVACWLISVAVYRLTGYDKTDVRIR